MSSMIQVTGTFGSGKGLAEGIAQPGFLLERRRRRRRAVGCARVQRRGGRRQRAQRRQLWRQTRDGIVRELARELLVWHVRWSRDPVAHPAAASGLPHLIDVLAHVLQLVFLEKKIHNQDQKDFLMFFLKFNF